jgi:hypothetical protein
MLRTVLLLLGIAGAGVNGLTGSTAASEPSRSVAAPAASFLAAPQHVGPLDRPTGRSHLTAFVSRDDGCTWGGGLLLDERTGVSYPDGQQTADGTIWISYDFSRTDERNILVASFREEDAAAGREVSGAVRRRQLVSKASGGYEKPKPAKKTPAAVALRDAV